MDRQKDEFSFSCDPARLDIDRIYSWLSEQSYWAKGVPRKTVEDSIAGSLCFGIYGPQGQVGFARVITDKATFGYLADVFVDPAYRGRGLSKLLMAVILSHPDLQGFRTWMLQTQDAHGLYAQSGFTPHPHPERVMTKTDPNVYKR